MLIIGCGNRDRGDDAAGLVAAERLRALGITTRICSGDCHELMRAWNRASDVVVIDCVVTGKRPGVVHVWDAHHKLPIIAVRGSTHGFGLGEAVELSRVLRHLPAQLRIYGIEGKNFEIGSRVSAEVEAGISEVVEAIARQFKASVEPLKVSSG